MAQHILQPGPAEGQDTFVASYYPNNNYGNQINLDIGVFDTWFGKDAWTLIKFDLANTPISGAVVSAILELYCYSTYGLYGGHITNAPINEVSSGWGESTVTWGNKPALGEEVVNNPFEGFGQVNAWWRWDVTALVHAWLRGTKVNNGVYVRRISDGYDYERQGIRFHSSDYIDNPSLRPRLVVTYTGEGLLFKDYVTGEYYADAQGNVLKEFNLGNVLAGQYIIKPVVLENATNMAVSNVRVERRNLPLGDNIEISATLSPFVPDDPLYFNGTFGPYEQIGIVWIKVAPPILINGLPNQGAKQFVLRATNAS